MSAPTVIPGSGEVLAYLRHTGWAQSGRTRVAEFWTRPDSEDFELLVPLIQSASDYEKRIRLLADDLAQIEHRDPAHIQQDIAHVYDDVTDLRALGSDTDDSIPLQAGINIFNSARRLVVAAASATLRRQSHIGRSVQARARQHADRVRLGHTKRGSYIVPIISRARPPELDPRADTPPVSAEIEESLFDRRVMVTMSRALGTLADMAVSRETMPRPAEVTEAVGQGLSYELCKAVVDVLSPGELDALDVTFNWARAASPPINPTGTLVFPSESVRPLDEIATQLRTLPREREDIIFGVVQDLHDAEDEPDTTIGVKTLVERRVRTVWITLDKASYRIALQCHTNKQRVVARGVLRTPPGRRATLIPSYFGPEDTLISALPDS
ncbi:hypothetical protein KDK95_00050 [Actinospica sp. MGRD01-02]|uniref:Uncharacterized protein n=1 Tax=Actinospica acidithermotolerans TaxID=2828514 RepID=A0A941IGI4_9ACTN|nr:hypothetical protein [Actinospica acidithermotolerans]MBR7824682.1 hypothetical protein [Actinospica acidithermotolerans]